jgi:hypothetical protein
VVNGNTRDYFTYKLDKGNNRLYRENIASSTRSELYGYHSLGRLISFDRGLLNGAKNASVGSFALDPVSWVKAV